MPALNTPPRDPVVAVPARRRVWKHPELQSHSLLVLTAEQIRLAPLAGPPKPETVAAVEAGADLDELLGPLATAVELAAVRRVRLELLTNSLVIEYRGAEAGASQLTAVFATPEAADACFTKVWRRLGEDCSLLPFQRDTWGLVRAPLAALAAVLAVTLALALVLNVVEDVPPAGAVSVPPAGPAGTPVEVPGPPAAGPFGWPAWKVACGLGGVAAALTQVWLYRRVTRPPVQLELIRYT